MWEQIIGGMLIGGGVVAVVFVCWRGLCAQWQVAGRLDAARRETIQKLRGDIDALPRCPDPPPPPPTKWPVYCRNCVHWSEFWPCPEFKTTAEGGCSNYLKWRSVVALSLQEVADAACRRADEHYVREQTT